MGFWWFDLSLFEVCKKCKFLSKLLTVKKCFVKKKLLKTVIIIEKRKSLFYAIFFWAKKYIK